MNTTKPFRSAFTKADFSLGNTVCTAGQYNKIGEFQVPAGLEVAIGVGSYDDQERAIGRIYMQFQTSVPAEIAGSVRLSIFSAQNRSLVILDEWRTEALSESTTRKEQLPCPLYTPGVDTYWVSEDKKFVLEFLPDATATISAANSTILIDITKRETLG